MIDALTLYRTVGYENISQMKNLVPVLMGKPGRYSAQLHFNDVNRLLDSMREVSKTYAPDAVSNGEYLRKLYAQYMPRTMSEGVESVVDVMVDVFKGGKTHAQIKPLTMDEQGVISKGKIDFTVGDEGIKVNVVGTGENSKVNYNLLIGEDNGMDELVQKKNILEGINYTEPKEDEIGHFTAVVSDTGIIKKANMDIEAPAGFIRGLFKKQMGVDVKNEIPIAINETEVKIKDYQDYAPML